MQWFEILIVVLCVALVLAVVLWRVFKPKSAKHKCSGCCSCCSHIHEQHKADDTTPNNK